MPSVGFSARVTGRQVSMLGMLVLFWLPFNGFASETLIYAPLPLENPSATQARNQPIAELLTELLGQEVRLRLFQDHAALLDAVVSGEAHLAELGPLPFLIAHERSTDLVPIAMFREADGRADYRCVIVAPVDGLASLTVLTEQFERIDNENQELISVALTRSESTCGSLATYAQLVEHDIDLSRVVATYRGGHDDVAIAVLREQFLIGGMKESVAQTFHGLGLRILTASEPVPGFVLVARAGLFDEGQLQTLTEALVRLDASDLQSLQNGRHGFAPFAEQRFLAVDNMRRAAGQVLQRAAD